MGKLVLYYSYTGNSARYAKNHANKNGAEIIEVKSTQKIGKFKAYTSYCLKARKGSPTPIEPLTVNLSDYSEIDVFAPVWANCIAPPCFRRRQKQQSTNHGTPYGIGLGNFKL